MALEAAFLVESEVVDQQELLAVWKVSAAKASFGLALTFGVVVAEADLLGQSVRPERIAVARAFGGMSAPGLALV